MIFYALHPVKRRFVLLRVSRVGQRYAVIDAESAHIAPRSLFEIEEVGWFSTVKKVKRALRKLPKEDDPVGASEITFTGSINGPGYWPANVKSNGPLLTMVGASPHLPSPVDAFKGVCFPVIGRIA